MNHSGLGLAGNEYCSCEQLEGDDEWVPVGWCPYGTNWRLEPYGLFQERLAQSSNRMSCRFGPLKNVNVIVTPMKGQ